MIFDYRENSDNQSKTNVKKINKIRSKGGKEEILNTSTSIKNSRFALKLCAFILVLLSLLNIALLFITSEIVYSDDFRLSSSVNALRFIILVLACASMLMSYRYFNSALRIRKAYREVHWATSLCVDKELQTKLIFEIFLSLCLIPPSLMWSAEFSQIDTSTVLSLDDIIIIPGLFRVYFLLKFLYEISPYTSFRSQFYLKLLNIDGPLKFSLKSYIKTYPILSIIAVSLLGLILNGLSLRVYEKSAPGLAFHSVWDQFYLLSMSQTTVGYGDTVPKSHIGRTICVLSGLFGVFLYSYMVFSITKIAELNPQENRLYNIVKYEYDNKTALKPNASLLLQKWWKLIFKRKKKIGNRFLELCNFCKQLQKFQFAKNKLEKSHRLSQKENLLKAQKNIENKMKNCLKYLKPFGEYEELGKGLAQEEEKILGKIQEIKSVLQEISVIKNMQVVKSGQILQNKPHMKILQERALKRMLSQTNISV